MRDAAVAAGSYVLVVGTLSLAFQVVTTARVAANFILYGITLALLGVVLPLVYTVRIRKAPLADLGLTVQRLLPSVLLGLLLTWDTYRHTLGTLTLQWGSAQVPLIALAITVGLFEAIFFRGWLQLRFEAAFGVVPGLVLAAACYSLYHVGYGMQLEELTMLFFLGLTYGAMFRLTCNIAVLWPLYTPTGGLYTTIHDGQTMPIQATLGFVIVFAVMVGAIVLEGQKAAQMLKRREEWNA